ncbi:tetracycline resistance MFS efflux pump [soil metagenome]
MLQQLNPFQRRGLAIVMALGLLYGCILASQFYVPRLVHVLGGSATTAGMLLALSLIPVFLLALFGRDIARRFSPRQVLRAGLAFHGLQLLLLAFADNVWMLIPSMIFGGFGYGLTFARLLNSSTELTPKAYYTQGIAYFTLVVQLGVGLGSVIAALMEPLLDTHGTFYLPIALTMVALVLAGQLPQQRSAANDEVAAPSAKPRGSMLEVVILMGVLGLTFGLPLQFVPMWLGSSTTMNFSPGYFLTTSFFAIMVTRMLFGHWLNGRRELRLVLTCFAVVSTAIAVLGLAHTPWQFVACAIFYGAGYSLLYPSCIAYMLQQVEPEDRAAWSVWVLLGYEVGTRCMPALFGMVADTWGFPVMFRWLAGLIALVGLWHLAKRFGALQTGPEAMTKTAG